MLVLSIDPGRTKCGIALCTPIEGTDRPRIVFKEIVPTVRVVARIEELIAEHNPGVILLGDGTQSATLRKAVLRVLPANLPLELVPEAFSTQRTRMRLQVEWLPKGFLRLIPKGLRPAPKAYDDYVAALLAEDWLVRQRTSQ